MKIKHGLLAFATALALPGSAEAQPLVRDVATSTYAVVADPVRLAFAPDGTLYVGRDASDSVGGAGDAVKIHRVAPGGSPVTEVGNLAIPDPDALIVDVAGLVSGTPGAVIVGGVSSNPLAQGTIWQIAPDGRNAVTPLFGPSTSFWNPTHFIFDSSGRLLFTDYEGGKIWVMTNGTPTILISGLSQPLGIAVDSQDRVLVNASTESQVRLYSATGVLITNSFVPAAMRTPLAFGPGGFWDTGVFYVSTNGDLMTASLGGQATRVGIGFGGLDDLVFGPDGALYASHLGNDLIWQITPGTPLLSIFLTATNTVAVSWPSPPTGWNLQQNTNGLSSLNWSEVTDTIQDDGTNRTLIVNPPVGGCLYRLQKP